jgi:N-acetylglutamate synthase-like GNAT family acetyltransferase
VNNKPDRSAPGLQFAIRTASPADAQALARLSSILGYPTTPQQVQERLARLVNQDSQVIYLAESVSEVIGFIHVHITNLIMVEPFAEIGGLVVAETQRGQGVGRTLMERAQAWATQKGLKVVNVRSNQVRTGAKGFYQHLGYSLVKTQNIFQLRLS